VARTSRKRFYEQALTDDEQRQLPDARRLEGLDEEIAVLRVRLRTALSERPNDFALLQTGLSTLARALATRYRLSPRSGKELGQRMASVLQSIGDQILPPE
jgi:hypothetical protein